MMSIGTPIKRVPFNVLRDFAFDVLKALGVDAESARFTAEGLCHASLRGVDSHGIRLLPHYVAAVQHGRINRKPDFAFRQMTASTGVLDADHGFGHAAGMRAMAEAIALGRKSGTGHVAVRNSSHCGAMSYFALEACKHDMIGMAFTHASPKVRSPNSTGCFFGINPLCMAAPMEGEDPFCFDSAPTAFTANKVKIYRDRNEALPENVAADSRGVMTTDPNRAEQLIPIGDYKGFGLAAIVDVLCGMLTGMPFGPHISMMYLDPMNRKRFLGQFYTAIRIDAFQDVAIFKSRMKEMALQVRSQQRRFPDEPTMIAGDPEKRIQSVRMREGIPIPGYDMERFDKIADEHGISTVSQR